MRCTRPKALRGGARRAQRARIAALAACLLLGGATGGGAESDAGVRLGWAVVHQHGEEPARPIDYGRRVVRLQSGDRIRLYLRPLDACHLYGYLYDSQKSLALLFPQGPAAQAGPSPADRSFSQPGNGSWYRLDEHGGVELFYLIVSAQRQQALESATDALLRTNPASPQRRSGQQRVLEEIQRLIREGSRLAGAREKPLAVAGDFRGIGEDGEFPGRLIEVRGVCVRTFRLQH